MNRFYFSLIAIVILIMNVCGFSSSTFASTSPTTYQQAIQFVKDKGIMTGSEDGQFHPELGLTRCELVKVAILATHTALKTVGQVQQFSDLPSNNWCSQYVNVASSEGIANGYPDGTFKPNRKVSQIEAMKILFNATGLNLISNDPIILPFTDVKPNDWWAAYIKYGQDKNLIPVHTGSQFGIQNELRRDETAFILWNLLKPISSSPIYGDAINVQSFPVLDRYMSVIHYCIGKVVFADNNGGLKSCVGKNTLVVAGLNNTVYSVVDSTDTKNHDMGPVLFKVKSENAPERPFALISYVPRFFAPNYYEASSERDEYMSYKMDPTYINFFFDGVSMQSKKIRNYPDGAQYLDQGELRITGANEVEPYPNLAVYWSNSGHKAVFVPSTCEMMGCIAETLMGYDVETDSVTHVTTEKAMGKTSNPNEFDSATPYWENIKSLNNNQWSAELVSRDGNRRTITFSF